MEIQETGIRGFLVWLQTQQPGLYRKIAPQLAAKVPDAFSDYHAGGWRTAGMSHAQALKKVPGMSGFGDPMTITLTDPMAGMSPSAPTVDVSSASNAGSASSSTTDLIGGIVKGVSSLYLAKKQADIQQQVVNIQLQRAQLGLPPMNVDLSNLGVPRVSVGLSSGTSTLFMAGGAALLLGMLFMGRRRHA